FTTIAIVPQPERFQLEMELGICLALGFATARVRYAVPVVAVFSLAALIANMHFASRLIQPIDVRNTIEYKEAQWLDKNMQGHRVFAPGSVSFWMNILTDTPQLGGCCDQGVPNFRQRVALYTLYSGQNLGTQDGEISTLWLQAYGVHALGVSGAGSREWYKPFANPAKFEGLLPVLWRDGGDVIYKVPQGSDSLAHVIAPSQAISRAPIDGADVAPLRPYVAALNDANLPAASMRWTSGHSAQISATFRPADLLSVQVSYDGGWHALVAGSERKIESDALGMMVIHPECTGACTLEMNYDGGREMRIAKIVSFASVATCLFLLFPISL